MHHTPKRRGVKVSTLLDPEVAELLEAWRQQHYHGRKSLSEAVRWLIEIYLGVKPPLANYSNVPGFNSAWEKTPGWELEDPRSPRVFGEVPNLRLV